MPADWSAAVTILLARSSPRLSVQSRSAGVTVGRVSSIHLDPKRYQGVVQIEIQRNVQFPSDSSLRILTSGLLGDQYVGIEPGAQEKMWVAGDKVTFENIVQREQAYDLTYSGTLDATASLIKGDIAVAGVAGTFSGAKDK